jgi:hyperosmotically inducible protein
MHHHRLKRTVHAIVFTSVYTMIAIPAIAQTPADNSKVNTRDRAKGAVTADQQKENAGDRDVARKIRQSLMKDKGLSTYAHNVKVIARGGQVTLKGPVRSEEEKHAVEAKATEIAGAGHVINEMSLAPAHAK